MDTLINDAVNAVVLDDILKWNIKSDHILKVFY